ncbi:MAG: metalloregulator ArsR/SmtB family transcription factor [Acetobacteraceae bacterium]|nr:metalloregulator ArsR/SmtB family transcription factor [Acetobacteraceae bacterium]MDW8398091.1 metalloregulator ArsR/SmtB family transcription factor [Acetobacteraceae bacterium]
MNQQTHIEFDAAAERAAEFLKALANPWRLRILCTLSEGPMAVGVLAARIGAREALVSQHLMRLRAEGLVRTERFGQSVHYSLASPLTEQVIGALHQAFCGPGSPPPRSTP